LTNNIPSQKSESINQNQIFDSELEESKLRIPLPKLEITNKKLITEKVFKEVVYFSLMPDAEQPKYGWKSIFELI